MEGACSGLGWRAEWKMLFPFFPKYQKRGGFEIYKNDGCVCHRIGPETLPCFYQKSALTALLRAALESGDFLGEFAHLRTPPGQKWLFAGFCKLPVEEKGTKQGKTAMAQGTCESEGGLSSADSGKKPLQGLLWNKGGFARYTNCG